MVLANCSPYTNFPKIYLSKQWIYMIKHVPVHVYQWYFHTYFLVMYSNIITIKFHLSSKCRPFPIKDRLLWYKRISQLEHTMYIYTILAWYLLYFTEWYFVSKIKLCKMILIIIIIRWNEMKWLSFLIVYNLYIIYL